MNPHRRRRRRRESHATRSLEQWRRQVEYLERRVRLGDYRMPVDIHSLVLQGSPQPLWCTHPACVMASLGTEPRARLDTFMGRRGRRARQLRVAVAHLDERYRDVTVPTDAPRTLSWWHRRQPWA